jgi:hypothetical protein
MMVAKGCVTESSDIHEACDGRRLALWFSEMCTFDTRGASVYSGSSHAVSTPSGSNYQKNTNIRW